MGEVPKWLPSDDEIDAAALSRNPFEYEGTDELRALIRAAVEKALAEQWQENLNAKEELIRRFRELSEQQDARHRREVIEARIDEIGRLPLPIQEASGPPFVLDTGFMWKLVSREYALRAELAALGPA